MSVTSVHLFAGAKRSTFAMLKSFGLLRTQLHRMPGLLFGRAMGCGRGAAFSIWPDWQRYLVMTECATDAGEESIRNSGLFKNLAAASKECHRWQLSVRKHGAWDGADPFALEEDKDAGGRVAVLTRAAISVRRIPEFIRHSRQTTEALEVAPGLLFSIGMGEYPLVRQATFSIWESDAAMTAYAYKDVQHMAAIRAKVNGKMFTEEMFVRFRIK